tara:strand:- start:165 stop:521 length:357 start_codon:yes stop_codon:yes gene_type:complete
MAERINDVPKQLFFAPLKVQGNRGFSLMILKGTKFQLKVWKYLKTIPKGKVKTYKQVAISIKSPRSARAVANACAKNPYAPKIPCHRVIRSDGALGGYSGRGGIKQKLKLLRSEKVAI